MSFTDSETGEPIDGKAYLLKSTDGEEVVDPKRLFEGAAVAADTARLDALEARVSELENAAATTNPAETPGA